MTTSPPVRPCATRSYAVSSRCNSAWRPTNGVIARVGAASKRERDSGGAADFGDFDRSLETLYFEWADRPRFDVVSGEANGLGGSENGAGLRDLLHAGRDVHGDADRGVAHVQAMLAHAQDHLAGIESDADLDRHAMGALDFVAVMAHEVLHGERGARGAHRVVLRSDRRAKQRHDPVAHHLAHRTAVLLDGLAHVLEHGIEQLARLFRIAIGHQFHRTLEVGEQHRDELAFALERGGEGFRAGRRAAPRAPGCRRGDRMTTLDAEFRAQRQGRTACVASQGEPGAGHGQVKVVIGSHPSYLDPADADKT